MPEEREDKTIYKVVLNHEEQYSILPGPQRECLGLERRGEERHKTGLSGIYQRSLDGYASAQFEKENAGKRSGVGLCVDVGFRSVRARCMTWPLSAILVFATS
jgi:hypothetical protein